MAPENTILKNCQSMTHLSQRIVEYALTWFDVVGHSGVVYTYPPGVYRSDTCEYDFNLGAISLKGARWTRLVNMYVDPGQLLRFKDKIARMVLANKQTHAVTLPFKELTKDTHKERSHPWGGCLSCLTYRGYPPTLVLHSRTTRIGYTSFLDIAMAYVIHRKVVMPLTKLDPQQVKFIWYVDLPQLSCIYILRYMLQHPAWKKYLRKTPKDQPWIDIIRNYRRIKKGNNKWGPTRRIYEDMHRKEKIVVPVDSLKLFGI